MLFITKEEEIQRGLPLQALYFYVPWMPYHKKFLVMIGKIESIYKHIPFFAVDAQQFASQCKRFSVKSVPTILILRDGKEIDKIDGLVSIPMINSILADI